MLIKQWNILQTLKVDVPGVFSSRPEPSVIVDANYESANITQKYCCNSDKCRTT